MARTSTGTGTMSSSASSGKDINELIRKKAYELYEKRGKKPGNSMNDWLEAERIVRQRSF
jgi:hypothetical protein